MDIYSSKYNKYKNKNKNYTLNGGSKECTGIKEENNIDCNKHDDWVSCLTNDFCTYKSNFLLFDDVLTKSKFSITAWSESDLISFIDYNLDIDNIPSIINWVPDESIWENTKQFVSTNIKLIKDSIHKNKITGLKILRLIKIIVKEIKYNPTTNISHKTKEQLNLLSEPFVKSLSNNKQLSIKKIQHFLIYLFRMLFSIVYNEQKHIDEIKECSAYSTRQTSVIGPYISCWLQYICSFIPHDNNNFCIIENIAIMNKHYFACKNLTHCMEKSLQFIIIPLSFKYKSSSHQNILIYDKKYKRLTHFEPHGIFTDDDLTTKLYERIRNLFEQCNIEILEYITPEYICPNIIISDNALDGIYSETGIQSLETSMPKGGYCVSWSYAFFYNFLLTPYIDVATIHERMMGNIKISASSKSYSHLSLMLYNELKDIMINIISAGILKDYYTYKYGILPIYFDYYTNILKKYIMKLLTSDNIDATVDEGMIILSQLNKQQKYSFYFDLIYEIYKVKYFINKYIIQNVVNKFEDINTFINIVLYMNMFYSFDVTNIIKIFNIHKDIITKYKKLIADKNNILHMAIIENMPHDIIQFLISAFSTEITNKNNDDKYPVNLIDLEQDNTVLINEFINEYYKLILTQVPYIAVYSVDDNDTYWVDTYTDTVSWDIPDKLFT